MTSNFPDQAPDEKKSGSHGPGTCKRPGCGNPLPATKRTRGRTRQFCSDACARQYHNAARIPLPRSKFPVADDPLGALDSLIRHAAVLVRTARDQATSPETAQLRARLADVEAACRRAEADATAAAEALAAARGDARDARAEAERYLHERDDALARAERAEARLRKDTAPPENVTKKNMGL